MFKPVRTAMVMALLAGCAAGSTAGPAVAQSPWSQRPTLSPYLDYFRQDTGILPQYQQFVRPKMQLRDELLRQNYRMAQQQQQISNVGRNLTQFVEQGVRPTGTRAGFNNHSHFYNMAPTGRR